MRFDARRCTALPGLAASLVLLLGVTTRLNAQGPKTSADTVFYGPGCTHDEWLNPSQYTCLDSTGTFRASDIRSATLTITLKNGTRITQPLRPGTDAIFLSNHALEKFLAPYYESVGDRAKAESIRRYAGRLKLPPGRVQKKAPPTAAKKP